MIDMDELHPKISIIGCGNVGMRYAYALAIKREARQIVIVDIDRKRLEGEVMDLSHGAPFIAPVEIHAGNYADLRGSDLVVITAGMKQKPGQSRIDLARDNVDLYRNIVPRIMEYSPTAIFLIVTNPVDVLSYAAYKLSSQPSQEIMGSGTVLDTARLRFLVARHCEVDPRNVHAYVLGEHGDSEFPVWSSAMIGGVLLKDYCPTCKNGSICTRLEELQKLFLDVRDSAYRIIERKGETSYGVGLAMVRITQAVIRDENAILPVSSLADDILRLGEVYLSRPAVVNRRGVREVLRVPLADEEAQALKKSAEVLRDVIRRAGL
jgi:L-lactate dehydrogenase